MTTVYEGCWIIPLYGGFCEPQITFATKVEAENWVNQQEHPKAYFVRDVVLGVPKKDQIKPQQEKATDA